VTDRPDDPDRPASDQPPPPPWGPPPAPPTAGYAAPEHESAPPYGAAPVYGTPPAAGPGQPQPYGYAPPYGAPAPGGWQPESPEQSSIRTQAILALIINIFVLLSSCFMALPSIGGAITAGIALGQVRSDPEGARRLVKWSWGLLIATVVIGVLVTVGLILFFALLGASADSSGTTTTGF
jgi:hypothetical protein